MFATAQTAAQIAGRKRKMFVRLPAVSRGGVALLGPAQSQRIVHPKRTSKVVGGGESHGTSRSRNQRAER